MFDCKKCLERCKADCCRGPIPIEEEKLYRLTPVRKIFITGEKIDGFVTIISFEKMPDGKMAGVCPFLGNDNRCTIYNDRPFVCVDFGTENSEFTICSYQDKNGRIRKRSERRLTERKFVKREIALKNKLKDFVKHE